MRFDRKEIGGEAMRLLALAWPVILTSLNWTVLQLIDVAFVGHAGTEELSALAAARTVTFVAIVMGLGAISGVLVFTARDDGAGHVAGTADRLRGGILAGLLLGVIGMIVLICGAHPAMLALGVPAPMAGRGASVVYAMALGFPGLLVAAATGYFLEGISRPARVTVINLITLPINAVLAWSLVGGHLGLPALGAVGGALATASVNSMGRSPCSRRCGCCPMPGHGACGIWAGRPGGGPGRISPPCCTGVRDFLIWEKCTADNTKSLRI